MSAPALRPGATIGIIGGGQLGRMLAMAAARLGYHCAVLDPAGDCPAGEVARRHIRAAYDDRAGLDALAEACDVVTYEFENVPVDAARHVAARRPVRPGPRALEVAQDRLAEKRFLNAAGIATARFHAVDGAADLKAALADFGGSGLLKTRRMGYDGKGQMRLGARDGAAAGALAALGGVPCILEELVDFRCEVSVIAARAADGQLACYDPAENVHREGILRTSRVPAAIDDRTGAAARAAAGTLLEALDYVGVVGIEFFVLADGRLLVNEFAPRVHNSGHWTEAACLCSQFEQHVRAIAGLALGGTDRHSDAAMENLIGQDVERFEALCREPAALVHLYGKAETRAGRKMGHVTRLLARAAR